jgi:hypothetical protein
MSVKVLIGCEFSGRVRDAFTKLGIEAWSCDLLDTEAPGNHYQCDIRDILDRGWDLMIAHPPCTHLASSGARWFKYKQTEQQQAIAFVKLLMAAPIPRIAIENPIGILSREIRKPEQIIQPWQFGHPETKATCLWLKNLPKLKPTNIVTLPDNKLERMRIHYLPPGPNRWKIRSLTYTGIAEAMAQQWSKDLQGCYDLK